MTSIFRFTSLFFAITLSTSTAAQFIDKGNDRVKTPLTLELKKLGALKPRSTSEITSSYITVGCETLDRDYTVWDNYKEYLPPLGVKKIRLQAGWAKCEKTPGVYDWKWLDEIIDYAVANNIEPWLQPSYGNPIYKGGGGINLLNSLMTSEEAWAAWDRWVEALVTRYKDRVKEWEIWNEPDHPGQSITAETTADLNIRTAEIIKRIQPDARIAGLAFTSNSDTVFLEKFLKVIAERKKLPLFTWITYHSYTMRPEDAYTDQRVLGLRKVLERYSKDIRLRQGENGAPSTYIPSFALSKYYWTEYTQAKYNMRRVIGDLGHDIETDVFTIIDIYYNWGNPETAVLNTKGLIQSDATMAAIRPKVAYYAIQNIASIFDSNLVLTPEFARKTSFGKSLSVHGFTHVKSRKNVVALWIDEQQVTNDFTTSDVRISLEKTKFQNPVLIDLITGNVYEIPRTDWMQNGRTATFTKLPLYDAPMLIADRDFVVLNPDTKK